MFTEWLPDFIDAAFIRNVVISVVFLLVMVLIRSLARRAVLKRESLEPEMRRRWVSSIGNVTGGLSMIGLAFIWASQIAEVRTLARGVAEERMMPAEDVARAFLDVYRLTRKTVVEEIVLRPHILGCGGQREA